MNLFGQKKDPRAKVNEMVSTLRKQKYPLQRDIQNIMRQQKQLELEIKRCAKSHDMASAKIFAKEYVSSKKAIARLYTAISHIDCVTMELRHQAAMTKVADSFKMSTGVMKSMSALIKLPELQNTMQSLSKEMMKLGMIEEMIDDTMESALGDPAEMDDLASAEVDRILWDITAGQIGKAPAPVNDSLPADTPIAAPSVPETDPDVEEFEARLAGLRG